MAKLNVSHQQKQLIEDNYLLLLKFYYCFNSVFTKLREVLVNHIENDKKLEKHISELKFISVFQISYQILSAYYDKNFAEF